MESSKQDPLLGMAYRHSHDAQEVFIVAYSRSKLLTFHPNDSTSAHNRVIDLDPRPCPLLSSRLDNTPSDIAVDWVTGIAYITHQCGNIQAYDPKSLLYATLFKDAGRDAIRLIEAVPSGRYEILLLMTFFKNE